MKFLPNPFYSSLTSAHARFVVSHGGALRFQADTIPFAAVPEPNARYLTDLLALLTPGEEIFVSTTAGQQLAAVEGLQLVSIWPSLQMRHAADLPLYTDSNDAVPLTPEDWAEMMELKARAFPGFFGPRAPELGSFFGVREPENGRLIAMGGERVATFQDREISALCTDPEYSGQGHAAKIIRRLLLHHAALDTGSILHVIASNRRVVSLYERLGFVPTGTLDFNRLRACT